MQTANSLILGGIQSQSGDSRFCTEQVHPVPSTGMMQGIMKVHLQGVYLFDFFTEFDEFPG